jgi:hypothetical protein
VSFLTSLCVIILNLYRYGVYFGSASAQVNFSTANPDTQAIYAGTEGGKLTLVIINKNPSKPLAFDLANVPFGTYFLRHFGGGAGVAKWQVGAQLYLTMIKLLTELHRQVSQSARRLILSSQRTQLSS